MNTSPDYPPRHANQCYIGRTVLILLKCHEKRTLKHSKKNMVLQHEKININVEGDY